LTYLLSHFRRQSCKKTVVEAQPWPKRRAPEKRPREDVPQSVSWSRHVATRDMCDEEHVVSSRSQTTWGDRWPATAGEKARRGL